MMRLISISIVLTSLILCCFSSCQTHQLEKKLDPVSKGFLTDVKYIITPGEHKRFVNLPPGEREAFIEEFWKRRDPDPKTDENEFKEAYFERIDEAVKLFHANRENLTDRGMIYVLFGPPDGTYESRGLDDRNDTSYIVWRYSYILDRYSDVRFYFLDRSGAGIYRLVDYDRSFPVFSVLQEVREYYYGQGTGKEKGEKADKTFFTVDFNVLEKEENNVKLGITLKIPYEKIWFTETEDKMETTLTVNLEILDASKTGIWEHKQEFPLSFIKKDLEERVNIKKDHVIDITPTISTATVPEGKYSLVVGLSNSSGGEFKKVVKIEL